MAVDASYAPDLYYATPPLAAGVGGSLGEAAHPVSIVLGVAVVFVTGAAFYYTEYMMD